jgi:hypothetical protein
LKLGVPLEHGRLLAQELPLLLLLLLLLSSLLSSP